MSHESSTLAIVSENCLCHLHGYESLIMLFAVHYRLFKTYLWHGAICYVHSTKDTMKNSTPHTVIPFLVSASGSDAQQSIEDVARVLHSELGHLGRTWAHVSHSNFRR